jgi:hypothetical protein
LQSNRRIGFRQSICPTCRLRHFLSTTAQRKKQVDLPVEQSRI